MRRIGEGLGAWVPTDDTWRRMAENVEEIAIILLDPVGRVASWNRGAEKLTGYTGAEIIGQPFTVFYPAEAVSVGHPERELEAAASIGRYIEEGWRVRKDGSRFWAEVVITAIYDAQGDVEGFGKLTRDLTLAKQAEDQRARAISLLETTAATDFLTGLPNRRSWARKLWASCDIAWIRSEESTTRNASRSPGIASSRASSSRPNPQAGQTRACGGGGPPWGEGAAQLPQNQSHGTSCLRPPSTSISAGRSLTVIGVQHEAFP
jgi:PAS domain S-box-containing protein